MSGELKQLADVLHLGDSVHFTGAVRDVPHLLAALDVFVLPSLNEGISNTILEAMACGLPVLASAVGGNVELVEDNASGRLFEPGDTIALADLLARYVAEPALRQTHGRTGRRIAENRFSLGAMIDQYVALYDAVRERRRDSGGQSAVSPGRGVVRDTRAEQET